MANFNIFKNNAFSTVSLSGYVQKQPFVPQLLGSLNIFTPKPVRTREVFVDRKEGGLSLIATSPDGAPPEVMEGQRRDMVSLRTTRLTKRFTLSAHQIDGIRASGSESELMAVQSEFNTLTEQINAELELTKEFHRLGALQGLLLDADGTSVIYDYSAEFNEAIPPAISFGLDDPSSDIHAISKSITRAVARAALGNLAGASIHAICGDEFYDKIVSHKNTEKFYLQQMATQAMRDQSAIFESFKFGGITYHNYQGTEDNTTVAVPTNEAKFFPVGGRDVFTVAYSPLESMDFVNSLGKPKYMMSIPDRERNMWVKGEIYSYPLHICQQPRLLRKGTT